jgi:hypothetical protein
MYTEILDSAQKSLIHKLRNLDSYYLAGGTAIALQLGHRKSIDLDFFADKETNLNEIQRILSECTIQNTLVNTIDQYTAIVDGVKITFLNYPYVMSVNVVFEKLLRIPDLLSLAASKAFTVGRRPKWKDYVDLYFLINKFGLEKIILQAQRIFAEMFNDKLLREQLAYFDDIDYTEKIDYVTQEVPETTIKEALIEFSLEI